MEYIGGANPKKIVNKQLGQVLNSVGMVCCDRYINKVYQTHKFLIVQFEKAPIRHPIPLISFALYKRSREYLDNLQAHYYIIKRNLLGDQTITKVSLGR